MLLHEPAIVVLVLLADDQLNLCEFVHQKLSLVEVLDEDLDCLVPDPLVRLLREDQVEEELVEFIFVIVLFLPPLRLTSVLFIAFIVFAASTLAFIRSARPLSSGFLDLIASIINLWLFLSIITLVVICESYLSNL